MKQIRSLFVIYGHHFISILFLVVSFLYLKRFSFFITDDAFIHFRISRNILEHGVPYYNADQNVMGSSPHLWINLVALYFRIFGYQIESLFVISWIACSGIFYFLKHLLKDSFSNLSSTLIASAIIFIFVLPSSAGLMETPLVLLLVTACIYAVKKSKLFFAGVLGGLALGTRPEFALILPAALLILKDKQQKLLFFKGFFGPLFIYLVYTYYYFQTPMPFPVIAKPLVYSINWTDFFTEMPSSNSMPNIIWKYWSYNYKSQPVALSLILLFLLFFWGYRNQKTTPWMRMIILLPFLILMGYFLRKVFVFPWYAPLYAFFMAVGFCLLLSRKWYAYPIFLIALFNPIVNGTSSAFAFISGQNKYFEDYGPGWRVQQYLKIGEELYRQFPDKLLMTSEIGALGWTFKGRIIDGGALVSPETLKFHPLPVPEDRLWRVAGSIPHGAVLEFKPDLIVSMPIFSMGVVRELKKGKLGSYELIKTVPVIPSDESAQTGETLVWSTDRIEIFKKMPPNAQN